MIAGSRNTLKGLAGRLAAEFCVVVLGITTALWADGWVAARADRAVEAARLVALYDNVSVTLEELHSAQTAAADASEALRQLVSLDQANVDDAEVERLLLSGFFYLPEFFPELNVYDDLKNSGELALLSDPELRRSLSAMEAILERVALAQADVATVQQLNFDPYLMSRVDLRGILGRYLGLDGMPELSSIRLDLTADVEFWNLTLFKLDLVDGVESQFGRAETILVAIQKSIATQLNDE